MTTRERRILGDLDWWALHRISAPLVSAAVHDLVALGLLVPATRSGRETGRLLVPVGDTG